MSCNKTNCNSCSKRPCVCHSCYDVVLGDCNTCEPTPATEIDSCSVPVYCEEGCEETISSDCIIMPDGTTLTETILTLMECCNSSCTVNSGIAVSPVTICNT